MESDTGERREWSALERGVRRRTRWFKASTRPARRGYYEVTWLYDGRPENWFNYWDGKRWHWGYNKMDRVPAKLRLSDPVLHIDGVSMLRWRGLEAPNASLSGQAVVLRRLLADALAVLRTIEPDDTDEAERMESLCAAVALALQPKREGTLL